MNYEEAIHAIKLEESRNAWKKRLYGSSDIKVFIVGNRLAVFMEPSA